MILLKEMFLLNRTIFTFIEPGIVDFSIVSEPEC
jgi:hypothetical protein